MIFVARAISESGNLYQRLVRGAHHRLGGDVELLVDVSDLAGGAEVVHADEAALKANVTLPPKFDRRFHRDSGGTVSVNDTGHHRIFGVAQAQSGDRTLLFTSQDDLVRVADLPRVAV
jgi:hypothetical protein